MTQGDRLAGCNGNQNYGHTGRLWACGMPQTNRNDWRRKILIKGLFSDAKGGNRNRFLANFIHYIYHFAPLELHHCIKFKLSQVLQSVVQTTLF